MVNGIARSVQLARRVQGSIGVNAAGEAGDASAAIFGQPGTKCLISPPKFVEIVIKLPAKRCNQRLWYKQDTQIVREPDSPYFA